jgi:hypothetical protein
MNDPYHVYMDLDVVNNDYTSQSKPQLRFEETRNTPFLPGDSADYFCSIVRFNIQTGNTLPVFIPRIETGQSDVNKTIYKVTVRDAITIAGSDTLMYFTGTASIMYEPEDLTAPVPASPANGQDLSSNYYYVYNYQHFINLVNKALASAFNQCKNAISLHSGNQKDFWTTLGRAVVPYFAFDVGTNRVTLHADEKLFDMSESHLFGSVAEGAFIDPMQIFMNDRLYELFAGLPCRFTSSSGDLNYRLNVIDRYFNKVTQKVSYTIAGQATPAIEERTVILLDQEMTSIALWNPVASIVFASSLLPIVPTQTSAPKDIGSKSYSLVSGGNNSNLLPVLSDFSIAVDGSNQYRPMVEYNPGAEYRLIDMNSTTNLNRIDIIVYWKDRSGGLHPFQLQPGCAASVKIMFRRKDFNVFQ